MKYDLTIAYRICPILSPKSAGTFNTKHELSVVCLDSFKTALSGLNCKIYALLDNCPQEYEELFTTRFKAEDLEIIHTSLGNKGTFKKQIEILSHQDSSSIVYFAEDDYFYIKNLKNMVDFLKSGRADFVTPYLYPTDYSQGSTILFDNQTYVSCPSTCLTFMTTKRNLLKNRRIFLVYSNWFGSDSTVWRMLTLGRTIFSELKGILNIKNYSVINAKIYGTMILFALPRLIRNQKYKLYAPTETFATHLEKNFLATGIDWTRYF